MSDAATTPLSFQTPRCAVCGALITTGYHNCTAPLSRTSVAPIGRWKLTPWGTWEWVPW